MDDPSLQRLLDRTLARRENLQKKMAEMNTPVRKRPALGESNSINVPVSQQDDESPKRQKLREQERSIHEDTPSIPSVKSRLNRLSSRSEDDEDQMETASSAPVSATSSVTLSVDVTDTAAPTNRRARLAALASNINNWEDDLSHHNIKPEEKPVKKVWQRPKPVECTEAPSASAVAPAPSKPPRTFAEYKEDAETKKSQFSPVKFSPSKVLSPEKKEDVTGKKVSQITVQIGGKAQTEPEARQLRFVEGRTTNVSSADVLTHAKKSPVKAVHTPAARSPVKRVEPAPVNATVQGVQMRNKKSNRRESFEPTSLPVSQRMSCWEQRVVESEQSKAATATPRPISGYGKIGTPAAKTPAAPGATPVICGSTKGKAESKAVQMKRAAWQQKVNDVMMNDEVSTPKPRTFGTPAPVRSTPAAQKVTSPIKSPTKVGAATRNLAEKLQTKLESNWQNNDIAERIKQQKEADMELLNSRWQRTEETSESECEQPVKVTSTVTTNINMTPSTHANSKGGGIPVPPPLPAPGSASTKKPALVTQKSEEEQKIKNDFENTLKAMGFAVESTSSLGHVAKIDLTPHKQKAANEERSREVKSEKMAGGRTKITVEERKVTSTTFNGDKVTVNCNTLFVPLAGEPNQESKTPPMKKNYSATLLKATQNATTASRTPSNGASSIYNIIKKGATPGATTPMRNMNNDLNDSSSSFEDEPSPRPVVMREKKTTQLNHRSQIPSTASSEYSDTADSQTEEYTEGEYTEGDYTEGDYTEGDYTEEYTEDETADETAETVDDYSDEEEDDYSEEESGGVDELLGEVMDDTVADTESEVEYPKPMPRYSKPPPTGGNFKSPQVRSPSLKSNNPPHTLVEMRYREKTTSTTTASSGSDSDQPASRRPVSVYSVDVYKTNNRNRPSPKVSVVRHSDERRRHNNQEEPLPYIPEKSVKERLQELQEMVNQEQTVIIQTSNALNQCCGENSAFANSKEAVECHRLLLVAYKKRETYLGEMTRLREGVKEPEARTGTLTISDIRLPMKRDYMNRIGTDRDTTQHFFICLLRNGDQLMVTKMVSTHDDLVKGTLDIPNILHLDNIKQNFKLDLDIYSMYISKENNPYTTPSKKAKTPKKTPLKGLFGIGKSDHRMLQSPAGPSAVRSSNFSLVATLPLTMRALGKTHFTLDRVPYQCPLQGTVHLTLTCLMESHIEERGFLTMFEDVTGFGAWHRRWCVLKDHRLAYWKYPSDERCREPMGFIDMKTCISENVGLIPRDICARPNTFELVTMRRAQRGEKDNLTKRTSANTTIIRHQLSADTKDERIIWCERLNEEMSNLRAWHSDAMPAMKVESASNFNTVV